MKDVLTPTPEELGVLIKATQAVLNQRMDEVLRPLGLTVAQYACLRNLSDAPGITSSELARRSFVSRQSMNVLLQGLEKMGLVDRAEQPGQRRERSALLAAQAGSLLAEAEAAVSGVVARMTEDLDAKQRSSLHDLLELCNRALLSDEMQA